MVCLQYGKLILEHTAPHRAGLQCKPNRVGDLNSGQVVGISIVQRQAAHLVSAPARLHAEVAVVPER